ncbi:MAG: DUF2079 domain-containing protein [Deltaproteobacteria bacterium]|nr:DUF2079 domain-containing protein [Deltaproteobacteria bacterium]
MNASTKIESLYTGITGSALSFTKASSFALEVLILIDLWLLSLIQITGGFYFQQISFRWPWIPLAVLGLSVFLRVKLLRRGIVLMLLSNPVSYLTVMFSTFAALILASNYAAYVSFEYSNFHDLALYNQAMFNFVHGRGFIDPLWGVNLLGDHSELIVAPISIIYYFFQSPLTLLYIQAIAIGAGIFPLYFLARIKLGNSYIPFIICFSYLTFPAILNMSSWTEFRPITFAIPILFTAFYFYEADRPYLFVFSMVAAALVKEEVPLVVATAGLYILLLGRKERIGYKTGLFLLLFGTGFFFLMIKVLIPYYGKAPYPHFVRLNGGDGIFMALLKNPLMLFTNEEFLTIEKIKYFFDLFLKTGFVPLFSAVLFIPLSNWAQVVLSPDASVISQHWHNTLIIIFIFISLVFGLAALKKHSRFAYALSIFAVITSSVYFGTTAFNQLIMMPLRDKAFFSRSFEATYFNDLKRLIVEVPNDKSVYTTFRALPYVSSREHVFWYPKLHEWKEAEYILFGYSFVNDTEMKKLNEGLGLGDFKKIGESGQFQLWSRQEKNKGISEASHAR